MGGAAARGTTTAIAAGGSSFDDHYGRGNNYGYYRRPGMCLAVLRALQPSGWAGGWPRSVVGAWYLTSCWCCRRRNDYLYPYGYGGGYGGYYGAVEVGGVVATRRAGTHLAQLRRRRVAAAAALSELDGSTGYLYPGSYPGSARRLRGDDGARQV